MPAKKRHATKYLGVLFIESTNPANGERERVYYIRYRRNGKMIEEKAGRPSLNDMTAAKASQMRSDRMTGKEVSNRERREAEKAEKQAKENRWTFTELWTAYKQNKPHLKGLTTDENRFKLHIEPAFGDKEVHEIITLDVDRLRLKLLKKRKPATVRNVLELLRRIINFTVRKGYSPAPDPSRLHIEMPRVNNERTEHLTPDQLAGLLEAIEADSCIAAANMMRLALFSGMRRGEIFRLMWPDIDFERGFIRIVDPKGGRDQEIPLSEPAHDLLKSIPATKKTPYVFPGRKGRQRVDAKRTLNRIRDNAGLPKDFRAMHGLRHAYASMLASSGKVDLYTLQKLLTHKSPAMTQRYAHLADEAMQRAANVAGDLFKNAAGQNKDESKVVNISKQNGGA